MGILTLTTLFTLPQEPQIPPPKRTSFGTPPKKQLWKPESLSQQPHCSETLQTSLIPSALSLGLGFITQKEKHHLGTSGRKI